MINPYNHPCDIGTIDYSLADQGWISCRECGKQWKFLPSGWTPTPLVRRKPQGGS